MFYVQTPGQIFQLAFGKLGYVLRIYSSFRLLQGQLVNGCRLLDFLFLPDINFRRREVSESAFGNFYKRPVMNFIERQGDGKSADWNNQHYGDEKRQSYVDKKNYARSAGKVNKLLEGQRPENFALYFYKLGDLKTHKMLKFEIRISKFETISKL